MRPSPECSLEFKVWSASPGVVQDVLVLEVCNPWRETNRDLCQTLLTEAGRIQAVPVWLLGLYLPICAWQTRWVQSQPRAGWRGSLQRLPIRAALLRAPPGRGAAPSPQEPPGAVGRGMLSVATGIRTRHFYSKLDLDKLFLWTHCHLFSAGLGNPSSSSQICLQCVLPVLSSPSVLSVIHKIQYLQSCFSVNISFNYFFHKNTCEETIVGNFTGYAPFFFAFVCVCVCVKV